VLEDAEQACKEDADLYAEVNTAVVPIRHIHDSHLVSGAHPRQGLPLLLMLQSLLFIVLAHNLIIPVLLVISMHQLLPRKVVSQRGLACLVHTQYHYPCLYLCLRCICFFDDFEYALEG
jgi:hypothetical protein